jgi:hypothetical protein
MAVFQLVQPARKDYCFIESEQLEQFVMALGYFLWEEKLREQQVIYLLQGRIQAAALRLAWSLEHQKKRDRRVGSTPLCSLPTDGSG